MTCLATIPIFFDLNHKTLKGGIAGCNTEVSYRNLYPLETNEINSYAFKLPTAPGLSVFKINQIAHKKSLKDELFVSYGQFSNGGFTLELSLIRYYPNYHAANINRAPAYPDETTVLSLQNSKLYQIIDKRPTQ